MVCGYICFCCNFFNPVTADIDGVVNIMLSPNVEFAAIFINIDYPWRNRKCIPLFLGNSYHLFGSSCLNMDISSSVINIFVLLGMNFKIICAGVPMVWRDAKPVRSRFCIKNLCRPGRGNHQTDNCLLCILGNDRVQVSIIHNHIRRLFLKYSYCLLSTT